MRLFYSLKSGLKGIPFYPDVTINRYVGGAFFHPKIPENIYYFDRFLMGNKNTGIKVPRYAG
jgi:hypothetical protein